MHQHFGLDAKHLDEASMISLLQSSLNKVNREASKTVGRTFQEAMASRSRYIGRVKLPEGMVAILDNMELAKREIVNIYREAAHSNGTKEREGVVYRLADRVESNKIASLLGITLPDQMKHSFINYEARHTYKEHGDATKEHLRGQLNINDSDMALVPDITIPENIIAAGFDAKNKRPKVFYMQKVNGHILVVEEVRTGQSELAFNSMRKYKSDEKPAGEMVKAIKDQLTSLLQPVSSLYKNNTTLSDNNVKTDKFGQAVLDRSGDKVILYHGGSSDNHAAIMQEGIKPNKRYGLGLAEPEQARLLAQSDASIRGAKDDVQYRVEIPKSEILRLEKDHASNEHPEWRMYNADVKGGNIKPEWIKAIKIGRSEWQEINPDTRYSRASDAVAAAREALSGVTQEKITMERQTAPATAYSEPEGVESASALDGDTIVEKPVAKIQGVGIIDARNLREKNLVAVEVTGETSNMLREISAVFGNKVVFYRNPDGRITNASGSEGITRTPNSADGFVMPNAKNTIYLNVDSVRYLL